MKSGDPLHVPWAFPLADAGRLPVTGEAHPLRLESAKWMGWASAVSLLAGLLAFGIWFLLSRDAGKETVEREVKIVRYTELGVPPSITQAPRVAIPKVDIARAVAPPSIGVPEPVPDELAERPTIATVSEMQEALEPISLSDLGLEGGDSLVVEIDVRGTPAPEEFVAVEEEPVRIHIDPPVYPDMARSAEIAGTVIVRALVGTDGKIKDVVVLEGHSMLRDAAIACARTAVFRPALLQHRPVEMWVVMPITFRLH